MLAQLKIEQFAIIEHTDICFSPGFNVLSGETGAGKSILIDALGMVLGNRRDAALIRNGQEKAIISAVFTQLNARISLALQAEDLEDPENLNTALIRRVLRANGSKASINDRHITGQKLKTVAAGLVSVHGQHTNQTLLKSEEQRRRLDRYGKLHAQTAAVQSAYTDWQQAEKRWQEWQQKRHADEERLSLLSYQLEEFDHIAPQEGEFSALSEQQKLLASADELLAKGGELRHLLHEGEHALTSALHQALKTAQHLAAIADNFSEAAELLEQSTIYLDEASDSLLQQLGRIEHDPEQLARTEQRMSVLHNLARKHKISPEHLPAFWQKIAAEHQTISANQQNAEQLNSARAEALHVYERAAATLTQARKKTARMLAREVENCIHQLGMARAVFAIDIQPAGRPAIHGMDTITYTLCANPGQKLQPLTKVASGGELSRISLAIEVACLDDDPVPSVIFDEIDVGIGGEVADTVGRLLYRLGQSRQVLCITHLPQVAAYADSHYRIEKHSNEKHTQTRILPLNDEQRIGEIARMLGSADSDTGREHARAMLAKKGTILNGYQ